MVGIESLHTGRSTPVGAVVAGGEKRYVHLPDDWRYDGSRPVVVTGHGHGGTASAVVPGFGAGLWWAWLRMGMAVVQSHAAGDAWGNDNAQAALDATLDWAELPFAQGGLGARVGKHAVYGFSMGGLLGANYARSHKARVGALLLACPAVLRQYLYDINVNGYGVAEMDVAYGGAAAFTASRPTHDPSTFAAELVDVPTQVWYDRADGVTPQAQMESWATAAGAQLNYVAAGHNPEAAFTRPMMDFIYDTEVL